MLALPLVCVFFSTSNPGITATGFNVATANFSGKAASVLCISAGGTSNFVSAAGITDSSSTLQPQDTGQGNPGSNWTDSVDFGSLNAGSGNAVATIAFRERANTTCTVTDSITAYTASNMKYGGTTLNGASTTQLSFCGIGGGTITAGANGDSSGCTYGPNWASGAKNLSAINAGSGNLPAPVAAGSDVFCTFTKPPSKLGYASSADNYVENQAIFTVPAGLQWKSTGVNPSWSCTIQFQIYSTP